MFSVVFFNVPFIFLLLGIIFTLCITNIDKIPGIINVNIGRLNRDDICKLNKKERDYLRNQILRHFSIATVTTLIISLAFVIFGNADNVIFNLILVLVGSFIELIVGLIIILSVIKKTNKLKK